MRALEVWLGDLRCALALEAIDEVLPLVEARALGSTPDWFVGVARLRGSLVPLIDAPLLVHGLPLVRSMNARTVLLYPSACGGVHLALLVDRVGSLVTVDFTSKGAHPGIVGAGGGALGALATDASGTIAHLDPTGLLSEETRRLFRDAAGVR
jgi:chemotaxis signal transduction protein